ncbi:peptidase inhibitor family I36 protein [Kitasatospora sp. NPDC051984]|uniref:peptidase inhibitor family I36 protein n=1 Tax=Kitasatospora sp. NPDC051984 TaxID=3364059 RepID=UPI0037C703CF
MGKNVALRKKLSALAIAAGISATGIATVVPANAASIPGGSQGFCGAQICLYYHSNIGGAMWAANDAEWKDLSGQTFNRQGPLGNGGDGYGLSIRNNAASVANGGYQTVYVYVYRAVDGWGPYDSVGAGGYGNLVATANNEASYSIYNH